MDEVSNKSPARTSTPFSTRYTTSSSRRRAPVPPLLKFTTSGALQAAPEFNAWVNWLTSTRLFCRPTTSTVTGSTACSTTPPTTS